MVRGPTGTSPAKAANLALVPAGTVLPAVASPSSALALGAKAKRRGNTTLQESVKHAKKELDAMLMAQPDLVFPTLFALKSGSIQSDHSNHNLKVQDEVDEDPTWNPKYKNHGRLPVYWLAAWLCQTAPDIFTDELMNSPEMKDNSIVRNIVTFATGIRPSHHLHVNLLNKTLCSRFYNSMYLKLGDRFSKANFTQYKPGMDWQTISACWWKPRKPGCLVHCSGMEVPPFDE